MKSFKYTVARSASSACELLGENSLAFAGGTSLLNLMKEYVVQPEVLVDIKRIDGLNTIESSGGGLTIGANVTLAEVIGNGVVREDYPALYDALHNTATPHIRNRGTIGGNLCARPACWYFSHEGFSCAKRGGTGCPAKDGENEFHAIFDTAGPCVMVHSSSAAPALIALDAKVRIASPGGGSREVDAEKFFVSPSQNMERESVLQANEIVTHVVLGGGNAHSATYEVRQKATHDWPIAMASVALNQRFGVCQSARIALGAVAPVPRRATGAERRLVGNRITESVAAAAAAAAVEGAAPLSQNGYKVSVARTAVKRAILAAAG